MLRKTLGKLIWHLCVKGLKVGGKGRKTGMRLLLLSMEIVTRPALGKVDK